MYPSAGVLVVSVLATKVGINTVKCKKCQLRMISKQTSEVKFSFYRVLEIVIKTLVSNVVNPTDVLDLLPLDIASRLRLEGATTLTDIFRECGPLDNKLKWYSFPLLVLLVQRFGDSRCKEELQDYIKVLQAYLRTRLVVSMNASTKCNTEPKGTKPTKQDKNVSTTNLNFSEEENGRADSPIIQVFIDKEWDARLVDLDSNTQERAYLADLLGTTADHLHFIIAIEAQ